jgi:hypothetical protein
MRAKKEGLTTNACNQPGWVALTVENSNKLVEGLRLIYELETVIEFEFNE